MADDALNRSEVEELLKSMDSSPKSESAGAKSPESAADLEAQAEAMLGKKKTPASPSSSAADLEAQAEAMLGKKKAPPASPSSAADLEAQAEAMLGKKTAPKPAAPASGGSSDLDAQVEAMLSKKTPAKPAAPAPVSELESKAEAIAKKPATRQRVVAYDFKRPERVGKEQMRALQSLHEGFARNFGASLSALLRSIVEVKLISVDQLTYSEFVYSLEIPTCFNLLKPTPLEGNWILDLSPSLLYPIIDRMLGGGSSQDAAPKRPLSEIELRLTSRITNVFLRELANAWINAIELKTVIERVESNPQLVQIVPPNEVVILVSFELTMGKIRGMINLCIPFNTIERIGNKLTSNSWVGYASSRYSDTTKEMIAKQIDTAHAEVTVTLAHSKIRTADLFALQIGDIISTEKDIRAPLDVEIEGVVKFVASPGAYKGRKAISIQGIVGDVLKSSAG